MNKRHLTILSPTFSLLGALPPCCKWKPTSVIPTPWMWYREDPMLKVSLGYMESPRPDGAVQGLSQQNRSKQQQQRRFASWAFWKNQRNHFIGRFWLSQILDKCELYFFFAFFPFPKKEITSCILKHISFFYLEFSRHWRILWHPQTPL